MTLTCDTERMNEGTAVHNYTRHRFPPAIIGHAVWLYFRFALSYRDVEELLAERGIILTYETVRQWCQKFGQAYANGLRRRRPRPGDKWHLDEVFITINGQQHYLWRAVDQAGSVLDILVQSRRDKQAAKRFFRKLLKGLAYVPRVVITDKLASYGAAKGTVKLSLLGGDGDPKVGNDRRIRDRIQLVPALTTASTGPAWGDFVQSKLNVTVPLPARGPGWYDRCHSAPSVPRRGADRYPPRHPDGGRTVGERWVGVVASPSPGA